MSFFEDLTPYRYHWNAYRKNTVNVGWLQLGRDFQTFNDMEYKESIIKFLGQYSKKPVFEMRGLHDCEFCNMSSGNGEIRVFGANKVYACPILIGHYVSEHNYKPPNEFLNALKSNSKQSLEEYESTLNQYILSEEPINPHLLHGEGTAREKWLKCIREIEAKEND